MDTYIEQSQIALRNALKERTKRSQMFKGKLFSKQTMMESEQNEIFQTKITELEQKYDTLMKTIENLQTQIIEMKSKETQLTLENQRLLSKTEETIETKLYDSNGNLIYEGTLANGLRNGYGIQYCPHSKRIVYQGEFKDGYYHGEGIIHKLVYNSVKTPISLLSGTTYYEGIFVNGWMNGPFTEHILSRGIHYKKQCFFDQGRLSYPCSICQQNKDLCGCPPPIYKPN